MGVYTRFKRDHDGFRKLIELIEATPLPRRQKMIDVGMLEDPKYTEEVLKYVLTFGDILNLQNLELAELLSQAPAQFIAYALSDCSQDVKDRFILNCTPQVAAEVREVLNTFSVTKLQIRAGEKKLIELARSMERKGVIKTKCIPITRSK